MIVAFLLANGDLMATECSSASVVQFGKAIKGVLAQPKNPLEAASNDAGIQKLAASPISIVAIVESYLGCNPSARPSEVEIAISTLQCLPLKAYLGFVEHLSHAAKSEPVETGLFYAVAPTYPLGWRLAVNRTDKRVKSTLREVIHSPNATPALQKIVLEIGDGSAVKALAKNPPKPLLKCGSE